MGFIKGNEMKNIHQSDTNLRAARRGHVTLIVAFKELIVENFGETWKRHQNCVFSCVCFMIESLLFTAYEFIDNRIVCKWQWIIKHMR